MCSGKSKRKRSVCIPSLGVVKCGLALCILIKGHAHAHAKLFSTFAIAKLFLSPLYILHKIIIIMENVRQHRRSYTTPAAVVFIYTFVVH
jgi:hypothetical protein